MGKTHYKIRNYRGELTGYFDTIDPAKAEAERLCAANGRKEHFTVVEMIDVWTTEPHFRSAVKFGEAVNDLIAPRLKSNAKLIIDPKRKP